MADVIEAVESMTANPPPDIAFHLEDPEVLAAVDRAMGTGTSTIIASPTVNIGIIQGGVKVNMIPDSCIFELDIRLPIGLAAEQVLDVIQDIVPRYKEASIVIKKQEASSNPCSFSTISHAMVNCLQHNAETLVSDCSPTLIPSMGATDCKHYRYAGIPAYVYGCSPYTSKFATLPYIISN